MKDLWLRGVSMDNDLLRFTLSHCVDQVEELEFDGCDITDEIVEQLAEKIKRRQNPVKCLPCYPKFETFCCEIFRRCLYS